MWSVGQILFSSKMIYMQGTNAENPDFNKEFHGFILTNLFFYVDKILFDVLSAE